LEIAMTTRIIGLEHAPLLERLSEVLDSEPDVVRKQIAIELLLAQHAMRMGSIASANVVIDGMCKHARQMMEERT
jgi:hypothetical protein